MLYDAECKVCKVLSNEVEVPLRFEYRRSILDSDQPAPACPNCNGEADKIVTGIAGFILKGPGWHGKGKNTHKKGY